MSNGYLSLSLNKISLQEKMRILCEYFDENNQYLSPIPEEIERNHKTDEYSMYENSCVNNKGEFYI